MKDNMQFDDLSEKEKEALIASMPDVSDVDSVRKEYDAWTSKHNWYMDDLGFALSDREGEDFFAESFEQLLSIFLEDRKAQNK